MDTESKYAYFAIVGFLAAILGMIGQCAISDHEVEMQVERDCMAKHCERGAIKYRSAYCGCEAVEAPR